MDTLLEKMMPAHVAASLFAASFAITIGIYAARGIAKMTREMYEYASDAVDAKIRRVERRIKRRESCKYYASLARTVNAI